MGLSRLCKSVQEFTKGLLDIHGQHDQQSLLSARAQLDVLDGFGHLKELRETFAHSVPGMAPDTENY